MKEVIFVTSNRGKFNSAKNFLRKYGIKVTQKQLKINEPRGSLEEIVIYKSKYAFKLIKKPLIVMDAGFLFILLMAFLLCLLILFSKLLA